MYTALADLHDEFLVLGTQTFRGNQLPHEVVRNNLTFRLLPEEINMDVTFFSHQIFTPY